MRARLRTLKWYAHSRQILFGLELQDVRDLLEKLPDLGESMAIERKDTRLGFVKDNLILRARPNKPVHPPERVSDEEAQRRVVAAIERQQRLVWRGETPEVTIEEICTVYARQRGMCALAGGPMLLDKAYHPQSLSLVRQDPRLDWRAKRNVILVWLMFKPMVEKWGLKYCLTAMRQAVKNNRKEKRA
jgi:hypothetical protein